jgi:hypothetical protein
VHIYLDGEAVEVEFVTAEEEPSRKVDDIRTMADREILHVREYLPAVQITSPEAIPASALPFCPFTIKTRTITGNADANRAGRSVMPLPT